MGAEMSALKVKPPKGPKAETFHLRSRGLLIFLHFQCCTARQKVALPAQRDHLLLIPSSRAEPHAQLVAGQLCAGEL